MFCSCNHKSDNFSKLENKQGPVQIEKYEKMKIFYFPLSAYTYFSLNPENIEDNATIYLKFADSSQYYQSIMSLIDSKNYKSNYGTFDKNNIRIKIEIFDKRDTTIYLIDVSGAIFSNGRSYRLTTIGILDSIINSCNK